MKKYLVLSILVTILILFFIFLPLSGRKERVVENLESGEKFLEREEGGGTKYNIFAEVLRPHHSCDLLPVRIDTVPSPRIGERAGIAILFDQEGRGDILYQKNIDEKLPIASLTKLMSAMIVIDKYPLDKEVVVSQEAVWTEGESGKLLPGERTTIKNLLYLSLLVSSNDAASALAEEIGESKFVDLMNAKTNKIGLSNTRFANSHGLDDKENFSTVKELTLLTQYSLLYYPSLWEILKIKEIDLISRDHLDRKILHHTRNTNKLILEEGVLGGKTGYTEEAKDTMILAVKAPGEVKGNIILVLLGVDDRIQRARELYSWLKNSYIWQ